MRFWGRIWLEDHLPQASAVTQVHKHDPPMVSPAVHPTAQDSFLSHMFWSQGAAIVSATQTPERV